MPRITVVLPVYNHQHYVEQTLHSLLAQDYSDFQIVAVDDGSSDASLEILNRHRSHLAVIQNSHAGPAAARNRALDATDSEFVAFMDADDLCSPERLRVQMEKIEVENLDLAASALSFIDSSGQQLPGVWARPGIAARDHWASLLERNWIGTPSVMLRRSAIESVGLFDETFTHSEDYDLWLHISRSHSIGYVDTPMIQCRRHSANTSNNIASHQHFERLALQKVSVSEAHAAFGRLYPEPLQRDEAWIWFLLRSGNPTFAEESESSLIRHPGSHSLRFARGVFQYDAGLHHAALVTFQTLDDPASLNNAAILRGDVRCLEAALHLRPDYHDAQYNLAALQRGDELRLTRRPLRESLVPVCERGLTVSGPPPAAT